MDFYDFSVFEFTVRGTRASESDTLVLSVAAFVDGSLVAATPPMTLGDFGPGTYHVQDYLHGADPGVTGVVINDPEATVSFVFQLLNAGNTSSSNLSGRTVATADALAGIAAGVSELGGPWAALAIEVVGNIYSWLSTSCDGPVAVDAITGPRYSFDAFSGDKYPDAYVITRDYPGSDSPDFCGINSAYEVSWEFEHYRGWIGVVDSSGTVLQSLTGVSATEHNHALHVFGLDPVRGVTHARTVSGAAWHLDTIPIGSLHPVATLPVSAVSFDDRLYVFLVKADGSISSLAYTEDGGFWTERATSPVGLHTSAAPATAVFRNRMFVLAVDSTTASLRATSSADLISWSPWADVPITGLHLISAPAAATLGDTLHVFAVFRTGKRPATVIMRNATKDGTVWTGWDTVEGGAPPEGHPDDEVLDVSATTFSDRVYLASRWQNVGDATLYVAVNFSGDGENWSGWRPPPGAIDMPPNDATGVAAAGNHLYVLAPKVNASGSTEVFAY
jgi:hypothetical protein